MLIFCLILQYSIIVPYRRKCFNTFISFHTFSRLAFLKFLNLWSTALRFGNFQECIVMCSSPHIIFIYLFNFYLIYQKFFKFFLITLVHKRSFGYYGEHESSIYQVIEFLALAKLYIMIPLQV